MKKYKEQTISFFYLSHAVSNLNRMNIKIL